MSVSERRIAREQFRRDVALMRQLGVARWTRPDEDIFLGPPPPVREAETLTPEQRSEREKQRLEEHRNTLFAASSRRPIPFESAKKRPFEAKSVVPHHPVQGRDSGQTG